MCHRVLLLFGKLKQRNLHVNCHVNRTTFQSGLRFQTGLSSLRVSCKRALKELESLMSLTLEKSFVKIYPFGCKTSLRILGKCVVEIYSDCTEQRTFATFHVIDAATSCILGKSTSELLCFNSS